MKEETRTVFSVRGILNRKKKKKKKICRGKKAKRQASDEHKYCERFVGEIYARKEILIT